MKPKNYFLLLCLLYLPFSLFSQSFQWGGQFGGIGEDVVKKMHVDADGNSYTTGYFTDTADFDITNDEFNLTAVGWYDVFVQKTNAAGELVWAVSVGSAMFDYGTGITTDGQGNVYITGYFDETADFDPGAGEALLTSQGGGDIFILKLDSDGQFIWAKSIGGADYEESTSIGVDELGNVYVLGYLYETMDFDPGVGEVLLSSQGGSDTFLLKLDSMGNYENVFTYGGDGLDLALDMFVKSSTQIFITGFFDGTTDLDPRPMEEYPLTATGDFSGYALQIDDEGNILNVAHTQGGFVNVYALAADAENNIYMAGTFSGTVSFDPATGNPDFTFTSNLAYNGFVMKVLADGTVSWARHLTSENPYFTYDIALGPDGSLFTAGFFEGTADFNPDAAEEFLLTKQSVNVTDAYMLQLDNQGMFRNAYQFGGVGFIDTHQLGVDNDNNVYLSAQFEASVDINPLPQQAETVSALDFRDNYLIKMEMGVLGVPSIPNQSIAIYPNPATETLNVQGKMNLMNEAYVIHNLLGQKIFQGVLNEANTIDVSVLQPGVYLLNFSTQEAIKFIKQ